MTPSPPHPERNTFLRGFGFVLLLHFAVAVLTAGIGLILIGLLQLAYVIPLAIKARRRHETARFQGILVAAGITILLNGACDAFVITNLK